MSDHRWGRVHWGAHSSRPSRCGHQVIVLDDLSTGFRWSVPNTAKLIVGDVGDFELVCGVIRTNKITSILHFAAKTVVPDSFQDPLSYYLTNAVKTRTLLAAAVSENVSDFIFSSTAAVYESSESLFRKNRTSVPNHRMAGQSTWPSA